MISADGEWIVCDAQPCEAKIKNHRWGKIKAAGWFFYRRDGLHDTALCPDHVPAWVDGWRARHGKKETK